MKPISLVQNTDSVDIDDKCLGVDVFCQSYPNRGLHIQIRHNGDKKLFKLACEIQRQIVEASRGDKIK